MNGKVDLSNVYSEVLGKISVVLAVKGTAKHLTIEIRETTWIVTQENDAAYGLKTHARLLTSELSRARRASALQRNVRGHSAKIRDARESSVQVFAGNATDARSSAD